jgi:hypothetical protein
MGRRQFLQDTATMATGIAVVQAASGTMCACVPEETLSGETSMAQFLTFWIDSTSTAGHVSFVGDFDLSFGFTLDQGPKAVSNFAAAGICLRGIAPGKAEFSISINGPISNHRFNLRFMNAAATHYDKFIVGGIKVRDEELVNTVKFV